MINKKEKNKYYKTVWKITNQNKHLVENIHLREWRKYSLDHKISIYYGFKNNIPPEIISHPNNLRIIPFSDNRVKRYNCLVDDDNKFILNEFPNTSNIEFIIEG